MLFFVFDILAVFFAILCAAFRSVRKEDQRRAKEIELAGITASDGNRNRDHERESAKDKHERSPFFFPLTSFHLLPTTTLKKKKTLNPIPLPKKTQIFRLAFGPKVFIVVSDPELTKQVLVTDAANYSKGLLSEILDFVMGQGLIPADGDVWRERRRAVVPALHRRYIESMLGMFGDSALHGAAVLERQMGGGEGGGGGGGGGGGSDGGGASSASLHHNPSSSSSSPSPSVVVEIENFFSRLTLDIIGKAVFNYDFGSLKNDDPFIQAVYTALREAEYRSTAFVPYWNFAPLRWLVREREGVFFSLFYFFLEVKKENQTKRKQTHIFSSLELPPPPPKKKKKKKNKHQVPRQRRCQEALAIINSTLDGLIAKCQRLVDSGEEEFVDEFLSDKDPSILHFLLAAGDTLDSKQLRDDLMTLLIAGHETTAAVLTWTVYCLISRPEYAEKVAREVDEVLGVS